MALNIINGTNSGETIIGTSGDDYIRAGGGGDVVDGMEGNDQLEGGAGNDILIGNIGADYLIGGKGNDRLTGSEGADQFRFQGYDIVNSDLPVPTHDVDTITDLDFAEGDLIVLSHFAPGTFAGTDINGQLDLNAQGTGANIRSWAGLVDLVRSSAAVDAMRDGSTDTLLLVVSTPEGSTQTIAIEHGWQEYAGLTNHAPVAVDDDVAVVEDALATGNVLANDSDVDAGDVLAVTAVGGDAIAPGGSRSIAGNYGTLTLNADGSYSYSPASAAAQALRAGQTATESFTYTVADTSGATSTATLSFAITGANDAPVAKALTGTVSESGSKVFTADFIDVDQGDTFNFSADTSGTKGKVTVGADGTFVYDTAGKFEYLKAGQTATDSFNYTVTDAAGASSTKSVSVTIVGDNAAPVALADYNGVAQKGTLSVKASKGVLANDSDPDGDSLSVAAVNGVSGAVGKAVEGTYGTLTLKADGSYTYLANNKAGSLPAKQVAQDQFEYTVSDGNGGTTTQTLTITVEKGGLDYVRGSDGCDLMLSILGCDILDGGNGDDLLYGGLGSDVLIGGAGNDIMFGGWGKDTFVFNKGFGRDTVLDFTNGQDTLQFSKSVFADFAAVKAASRMVGNDLVIDAGDGNVINLWGFKMSQFDASDVILV